MSNEIKYKLRKFTKKYYANMAIKGLIYTLLLLICLLLALNIIEYFGWNTPLIRTIIFYSYIALALVVIAFFIIRPLLKIINIGNILTDRQAANIIGKHFPNVQDKLLNLLQLQDLEKNKENSLLSAAIEQKTKMLSPIPFTKAVNTAKTKKYSKILALVLTFVLVLALIFPKLFSEPATRYINHNIYYEKPAPFSFKIESELKAVQQSDYLVKVKVFGKALPEKVNVIVDGQSFEMKQIDKTHFQYQIIQIQKTTPLQFEAADVYSKIYYVEVNPKPILTDLSAEIIYPKYTRLYNETINNITSLSVPKGTNIHWHIATKDVKNVYFNKNAYYPNKKGIVNFTTAYLKSENITIKTKNDYTLSSDSITFNINIIEDERPHIAVIEQKDSLIVDNIYFRGQITDDYGFSKLEFDLKVTPKGSKIAKIYKKKLKITNNENSQEFYHVENLDDYNISIGDKVEYYFTVWDNDAIGGAKSTRSQTFTVNIPDAKDIENKIYDNSSDIKKEADNALRDIKRLQQEINELTKKLTEKKEISWQEEKDLKTLQQKQAEIQQKVQRIEQKIQENSAIEEKYKDIDPELLEKQKQIEDIFKQLQNKDLENLMQKVQELMNKNINKDKFNESLKNIQKNNEEISKQLDKNLEMYKRLEVEKDINETVNKLNELSKEQEKLSDDTKQKKENKELLEKRQNELNKDFNELQKKIDEIKKKDSKLEDSFDFKTHNELQQQIKSNMQQAKENINKGKNNKASENQRQASQQMQSMAKQMQEEQEEQEQEQLAEDINNVRQILKNLVTLSKKQEDLIYQTQKTAVNDTYYQSIINKQNALRNAMQAVNDSLYAISKRQPQVSKTINDETFRAISNIDKSLYNLLKFNQSYYNSFRNNQAAVSQQNAMSGINNLSLLLAESLDNMNKQQSQQRSKKNKGKASKMCNNPASGKNGQPKNMSQLQDALNKEIQRLQKELEKQAGKKQKIGEGAQLNEALAKAAAKQEMIRKAMQEYINQMKKDGGKGLGAMNQILKQMEDTEKDIVNKSISNQTINRQNNILTRMLESEKAQKKQGKEEKRESKTGIDKKRNQNEALQHFEKLKDRDMELFKKISPEYSPYYKAKINEYFNIKSK